MRRLLARSPIDGFVLAILAAVVVAAFLPARGTFAEVLDWAVTIAIGFLFFLYGARLHPREALKGLSHWRLHLTILAFTFLVVALMSGTNGVHISASSVVEILLQILVPFIAGQLCRPLVAPFLKRYAEPTKFVDRASIVLVVYAAFSEGVRNGIWSLVSAWQVVAVAVIAAVLVIVMLVLTWWSVRRLGFSRADAIAIQFCGTKKSLATGLPMATVLFGGSVVGLIVLPLMIFHQIQLIICSWLATRYSRNHAAVDAV